MKQVGRSGKKIFLVTQCNVIKQVVSSWIGKTLCKRIGTAKTIAEKICRITESPVRMENIPVSGRKINFLLPKFIFKLAHTVGVRRVYIIFVILREFGI